MSECIYCGAPLSDDVTDFNHWRQCTNHPARAEIESVRLRLAAAERERDETAEQLAACRALLREACERPYSDPRDYDWLERARAAGGDDGPEPHK